MPRGLQLRKDTIAAMRTLRREKRSVIQIARAFGVSRMTVYRVLGPSEPRVALDEHDVLFAFKSDLPAEKVARRIGCSVRTVRRIRGGQTHTHITGAAQ